MFGLEEYTSPSTPPKKYRKQTLSGAVPNCGYNGPNCSAAASNAGAEFTVGGETNFDASTGVETNTQYMDFRGSDGTPSPTCGIASSVLTHSGLSNPWTTPIPAAVSLASITTNQTQKRYDYDGHCSNSGAGVGYKYTGYHLGALSVEDTEDDAIGRANAGIGSWSSCTPFGDGHGCSTYKVLRGAGAFSLGYRSLQIAVQSINCTPGVVYNTTINLQRRLQGTSDAFVDWITMSHEFVGPAAVYPATTSSYAGPWLSVPSTSGYEVIANSCSIVAAP
jgi:hypothetical protein